MARYKHQRGLLHLQPSLHSKQHLADCLCSMSDSNVRKQHAATSSEQAHMPCTWLLPTQCRPRHTFTNTGASYPAGDRSCCCCCWYSALIVLFSMKLKALARSGKLAVSSGTFPCRASTPACFSRIHSCLLGLNPARTSWTSSKVKVPATRSSQCLWLCPKTTPRKSQ